MFPFRRRRARRRGFLLGRVSGRHAAERAATDAPSSRVDALERLAALHAQGALDDEEFAREKRRLLG